MNIFLSLIIFVLIFSSAGCVTRHVADPAIPDLRQSQKSIYTYDYTQSVMTETDNDTEKFIAYRVAIKPFDDPYVPSSLYNSYKEITTEQDNDSPKHVRTITKRPPQPEPEFDSKTVAAAITDALIHTQRFEVIERPDINSLLREIEFNESKWVAKEDNTQKTLLSPVDMLLSAAISNKSESFSNSHTVFFRLYSVKTGAVLYSARGTGNSLFEAIDDGVHALSAQMYNTPWTCEVVDIHEDKVIINAGSEDTLQPGDRFSVFAADIDLNECQTSEKQLTPLARLEVTKITGDDSAEAKIISGNQPVVSGATVASALSISKKHRQPSEIDRWNSIAAKYDASPFDDEPSDDSYDGSTNWIARIVNNNRKSVVVLTTDNGYLGSGFIADSNGRVITNHHVIEGAHTINVKFSDGSTSQASVKYSDQNMDIAILQLASNRAVPCRLGNSDQVKVGDAVVAIGNPQGLEASVSDGIISAIREEAKNDATLFQTSAPLSSGSSGGPLFNKNGEVIGITTATVKDAQNLNFAIPINYVKKALK